MNKNKDIPKKKAESERFQLIYEKVLGWGVLLLALVHMLSALTRYIFDYFSFIVPFERWFTICLAAAGLVYLLLTPILWRKNAKRLKIFFKKAISPLQIYCAVLFLWYILTCWVNEKEYGPGFFALNDWWLLDTFINCIILFSLPRYLSGDKGRRKLEILLHIVIFVGTLIALYALYCLFTLNVVTLPSGSQIGMQWDMAFNIGCHYNISAAIELTMVLISLYMLASQKTVVRILYAAVLLVHTYTLLLNNSRTGFVSCMASYALAVFLILWNMLYEKPAFLRWTAGFLGAAAIAGVLWVVRPEAFQLFENITHYSELVAAQQSEIGVINYNALYYSPVILQNIGQYAGNLNLSGFFLFPLNLLRKQGKRFAAVILILAGVLFAFRAAPQPQFQKLTEISEMSGNDYARHSAAENQSGVKVALFEEDSTPVLYLAQNEGEKDIRKLDAPMNRVEIWRLALAIMGSNPIAFIFGVTPAGVSQAMIDLARNWISFAHAHNEVLQMGASMGVPMMILFVAFLIYMAIKSVRLGMIEGRKLFKGAYMIPVVFAGYIVLTLPEAYLFGYYSIMSSVFFLFCGWINALTIGNEK